jgi:Icc-related predicted phosphoesterase
MGLLSTLKEKLNQEQGMSADSGFDAPADDATRLFFATDVHGSTACWQKFVNAADFYHANVLVLGGDTTGKAIFPIIDRGDRYTYTREGEQHEIHDDAELEEFEAAMENRGFYPYVLSESEYDQLAEAEDSQDRQDELFEQEMIARIRQWTDFAESRLPANFPIYICPGNDDPFAIDDVWRESDLIDLVEGEVVELDCGYEMVSSGWTNPTPWDTDREEDEDHLKNRMEGPIQQLNEIDRSIFNLHAPPYDSQLDEAPELDEDRRPKYGGRSMEPVGSTAVRELIEEYQPPLSLHGHIHESRGKTRIGDTIAINPGSVYSEGSLQGAVIDLADDIDVVGLVRG